MEREHGVVGRLLAHGVLDKRIPPLWENRPQDFPLTGEMLERRHRRSSSTRATSSSGPALPASTGPIWRIPHPAWPAPTLHAGAGRRLPVFGAFGNVNASKRVPQLLEAFARVAPHAPGRGAAARRRASRRASTSTGGCSGSASTARASTRHGWVDERRLWALMAACDVHVSLRSPTMGETSGTAIRALSLGKPLVVSANGWFAELPDDVAVQVPVDETGDRDAGGGARAARLAARRARGDGRGGARAGPAGARRRPRRGALRGRARAGSRRRGRRRRGAGGGAPRRRRRSASSPATRPPGSSRAGSPRSSLGSRLRAVPAWGWLAVIVLVSFVAARLARPRDGGAVRDGRRADLRRAGEEPRRRTARCSCAACPTSGYSVLYPLAIAPPTRSSTTCVDAYAAAKTINALLMSLAAVPAYLLARRVASERLSLLAAVLAVALPSLAYTGTHHDGEPLLPGRARRRAAAGPLSRAADLGRLVALGAALAVAYRPARRRSASSPSSPRRRSCSRCSAATPGRCGRSCSSTRLLAAGALAVVVVAAGARAAARLRDLLGAYSVVGEGGYDIGSVAPLLALARRGARRCTSASSRSRRCSCSSRSRAGCPRRCRSTSPLTVASVAWGTLVVGAFASRFASDRVQDRYLFYLAPLLLVVACSRGSSVGAPRPPRLRRARGARRARAAARLPLHALHRRAGEVGHAGPAPAVDDQRQPSSSARTGSTVALVGAALVALFLLVPTRASRWRCRWRCWRSTSSSRGRSGRARRASCGRARARCSRGSAASPRDWIDAAVPDGAEVAVLWTRPARPVHRQPERVLQPRAWATSSTRRRRPRAGSARLLSRSATTTASSATLTGAPVRGGRISSPTAPHPGRRGARPRRPARTDALAHPTARSSRRRRSRALCRRHWSGPEVTWTKRRCRGGSVTVSLSSDPSLFDGPQTISATTERREPGSVSGTDAFVRLDPTETATLRGSARAGARRRASSASRSRRPPSRPSVLPGSTDDRELGAHFNALRLHAAANEDRRSTCRRSRTRRPGSDNYIRGSLGGLVEAAAGATRSSPSRPRACAGPSAIEQALDGHRRRAAPLAAARLARGADGLEPARPARRRAPARALRRAPLLGLDVPAAARRSPGDDDPRPRAAALSGVVTPRTRAMHSRKYANAALTCDLFFVNSAYTGRDVAELLGVRRGADRRRAARRPGRVRARRARGRPRRAVRAHGGDARAAQEPAGARRGAPPARRRPAARGRGRRGLGRAAAARRPAHPPARLRRRRRAGAAATAVRPCRLPLALRGLRHARSSRRWRAAARSWPRRTRRSTRRAATRPSAPTPTTRRRSPRRSSDALARRDELVVQGCGTPPASRGARSARSSCAATRRLMRRRPEEVDGRGVPARRGRAGVPRPRARARPAGLLASRRGRRRARARSWAAAAARELHEETGLARRSRISGSASRIRPRRSPPRSGPRSAPG